jgi:hypothetical protein
MAAKPNLGESDDMTIMVQLTNDLRKYRGANVRTRQSDSVVYMQTSREIDKQRPHKSVHYPPAINPASPKNLTAFLF